MDTTIETFVPEECGSMSGERVCRYEDHLKIIAELKAQIGAAPAGGLSDARIEAALDTNLGLDYTLRQLIRGDTFAVGYAKVDVVRALLNALGVDGERR